MSRRRTIATALRRGLITEAQAQDPFVRLSAAITGAIAECCEAAMLMPEHPWVGKILALNLAAHYRARGGHSDALQDEIVGLLIAMMEDHDRRHPLAPKDEGAAWEESEE